MITFRDRVGRVAGTRYWETSAWDGQSKIGHVRGVEDFYDGERVIDIAQSQLEPKYKRQGVGKEMYERFARFACTESGIAEIVSRGFQRSSEAERVWRSMERRGRAQRVRRASARSGHDWAILCE